MSIFPPHHWTIGSNGVFHGIPGGNWERIGAQEYGISSLIRKPDRLLAGASWGSGLWEWTERSDRWKQLHDETLTEVLAIASIADSLGVVAGSPFGIATGRYDEIGAVRWTHHSDALRVNERFTNTILVHPDDPSTWLIGTEAGVLIVDNTGANWHRTTLSGTPVRALAFFKGFFWAGTDDAGIWYSEDGIRWDGVAKPPDGGAIFGLSEAGDNILAATEHGVVVGDKSGHWIRTGPRHLCTSVVAHPGCALTWMAGAAPGGLWYTKDSGGSWCQIEGFIDVRVILAPETA